MRSAFRLPDWSLRTRLLLLLVGLAVVGLAAADFASYRALHNYLYDRVDQQLESAVVPMTIFLTKEAGEGAQGEAQLGPGPATDGGGQDGRTGPGGPDPSQLPPGTFGQLRSPEGEVISHSSFEFGGEEVARPQLPGDLSATQVQEKVQPTTVGARGGGSESFRVAAVEFPSGAESIVAVPLGDT